MTAQWSYNDVCEFCSQYVATCKLVLEPSSEQLITNVNMTTQHPQIPFFSRCSYQVCDDQRNYSVISVARLTPPPTDITTYGRGMMYSLRLSVDYQSDSTRKGIYLRVLLQLTIVLDNA